MNLQILILDTNIVSYLFNGHSFAALYRPHLVGRRLALSFMTVAEMYEGAYRGGWDAKRVSRLRTTFKSFMIVPPTTKIIQAWGRIRTDRKMQPIAVDDAWIAATAVVFGCPLVTHNSADFHGISKLKLITAQSQ